MVDFDSMNAALTGLNTAVNIGNSLLKLVTGTKAHDEVVKLNTQIISSQRDALAAYTAQLALLKQVDRLEEEIARIKAWDAEKQKYELYEHTTGIFTRRLKADMQGGEPMHEICATCYENQRKSPLQAQKGEHRTDVLLCPVCKTALSFYS